MDKHIESISGRISSHNCHECAIIGHLLVRFNGTSEAGARPLLTLVSVAEPKCLVPAAVVGRL